MHAFLVDLENKPGALAQVAEAIAGRGINITNIAGAAAGSGGRIAILTADDATTREALRETGSRVSEMDIVSVPLRDQPGSLAQATRRLADAGINIEAILPMGMSGNDVTVGFVTEDAARARQILEGATTGTR